MIGVIACCREVEGEPAQAVKHRYLEGVSRYASAVPLIVPGNQKVENAAALVARLDAVLLTGSNSNIAPARYGSTDAERQPVDAGRDDFSTALIRAAIAAGKPVIGICRGLQEINVALGGTLRDLRDAPGYAGTHHAPNGVSLAAMFAHSHAIEVDPGTPIAEITGSGAITVNSVHYQAIDQLAEGLSAAAKSADGVIEAVYATATRAPVIAVQWHPEWRPDTRMHDLAFWRYVGEVAQGKHGSMSPMKVPA